MAINKSVVCTFLALQAVIFISILLVLRPQPPDVSSMVDLPVFADVPRDVAQGVMHPRQLGVHHLNLFGVVENKHGEKHAVVLVAYVKITRSGNTRKLRAMVIPFDPTRQVLLEGRWPFHAYAPVFYENPIRFYLRPALQAVILPKEMDLSLLPFKIEPAPFALHLDWDVSQEQHAEYYFCVQDWPHTALITEDTAAVKTFETVGDGPPLVYAILKPFFLSKPLAAAEILALFAAYHHSFGFTSTVLYERGTYMRYLLMHHGTAGLLRSGVLKLMLWDHDTSKVPLQSKSTHSMLLDDGSQYNATYVSFDQLLVLQHAVTAFWGTNSWLFIADQDEFLASPGVGSTIQQLIQYGCLQGVYAMKPVRHENVTCGTLTVAGMQACLQHPTKRGANQQGRVLVHANFIRHTDIHNVWLIGNHSVKFVTDEQCVYIAHVKDSYFAASWYKHD